MQNQLLIGIAAAALLGASALPAQAEDHDHHHDDHDPGSVHLDDAPGTGACASSYSLTPVADLGGTAAWALGLSDSGWVAGTARSGDEPRPQLPIRQRGSAATALQVLDGADFARAMDVNDRGTAVGEAFTPGGDSRAVRWNAAGTIDVLPGLGTPGGVANAVNNRGDVAGASGGRAVVWPATGKSRQSARALPLHTERQGAVARATDIDEDGTVVGSATVWFAHGDHEHQRPRAMQWDRTGVTHLGGLAHDRASVALAVSGDHVVGEADTLDRISRAVFFDHGRAHELPSLGLWPHARANDVNADGVVVGHESQFVGNTSFGGSAVVWCDERAVALDDAVSDLPEGWTLRSAEAVNASGQIAGYGSDGSHTVGFLLTPQD